MTRVTPPTLGPDVHLSPHSLPHSRGVDAGEELPDAPEAGDSDGGAEEAEEKAPAGSPDEETSPE